MSKVRTINPTGPVAQLFLYGAAAEEVDRCLRDTGRRLIAAGARGNVARSHPHQAVFLAALPPKAMLVVKGWFREKANFGPIEDAATAAAEVGRSLPSGANARPASWRSALHWFCQPEVPSVIEEALAPPRPVVAAPREDKEARLPAKEPSATARPAAPQACKPTRIAWLEPRRLGELVHEAPSSLPVMGHVKTVLESGQAFVKVAGLVLDDAYVELGVEDARRLFPPSGDLVCFPGMLRGAWPRGSAGIWLAEDSGSERGSRWAVTATVSRVLQLVEVPVDSGQPDAVRAWLQGTYQHEDHVVPVFRTSDGLLFKLPGDATDPARARFDDPLEGFKAAKAIRRGAGAPAWVPVHLLGDPRPFDCASASTWAKRLLREAIDAGVVPTFTKAQVSALVEFASRTEPSRRQSFERALAQLRMVDDLHSFLDDATAQLMAFPAVRREVDAAVQEALDGLRTQKGALQQQVDKLRLEKAALERSVEAERQTEKAAIDGARAAARQQEAEVQRRVREAFDRSVSAGIETLAQVELFRTLLAPLPGHARGQEGPAPSVDAASEVPWMPGEATRTLSDARTLGRALEASARRHGVAELLLRAALASSAASGGVGLAGPLAGRVGEALAQVVAGGVLCEVSVTGDMFGVGDLMRAPAVVTRAGASWVSSLGRFVEAQRAAGMGTVVLLSGLNRAPPEALLPELLRSAAAGAGRPAIAWTDAGVPRLASMPSPMVLLMSFVEGSSTFALPCEFAASLPGLPATEAWEDHLDEDPSVDVESCRVDATFWHAIGRGLGRDVRERVRQCAGRLGTPDSDASMVAAASFLASEPPGRDEGLPFDAKAVQADARSGAIFRAAYGKRNGGSE